MSTAATPAATATATATSAAADKKGTAKPTKPRQPRAPKKTNKAVDPKVICEQFAQQVMDRYQLENDVMASMSEVVLAVLNNYHIYNEQQTVTVATADASTGAAAATGKGKKGKVAEASDKPKKPRKSSAYNIYVKEMMQDPKVKTVPQKEKMTIIGNMWKALPEAGRAPYQTKATELNATLGDDAETATQVTTN